MTPSSPTRARSRVARPRAHEPSRARTQSPTRAIASSASGSSGAKACQTWIMSSHTSRSTLTPAARAFAGEPRGVVEQRLGGADVDQQRRKARAGRRRAETRAACAGPGRRGTRPPWAGAPSRCTMGSAAARVVMDSPVQARSVHGEMQTPAAGSGSPASRSATRSDTVSPPPAESPATTIVAGSAPLAHQPAVGGRPHRPPPPGTDAPARDGSRPSDRGAPLAAARRATSARWVRIDPTVYPPPWR